GFLELADGRVEQVLAVLVADLGGADRAHERGAGQRQRGRGADQGEHVAVDLRVHRHHGGDDLDFVLVVLGEQRADRTVDQARDQGFLLRGAAFALEETTRDAAAGVELFLVVDGEGEEVLPLALRLGRDRGDQQYGAVALDHDRAAGLARDLAGLQRDFMVAVLEGLGDFRHVGIPWMLDAFDSSKQDRGALLRRGRGIAQRRRPSFWISALYRSASFRCR